MTRETTNLSPNLDLENTHVPFARIYLGPRQRKVRQHTRWCSVWFWQNRRPPCRTRNRKFNKTRQRVQFTEAMSRMTSKNNVWTLLWCHIQLLSLVSKLCMTKFFSKQRGSNRVILDRSLKDISNCVLARPPKEQIQTSMTQTIPNHGVRSISYFSCSHWLEKWSIVVGRQLHGTQVEYHLCYYIIITNCLKCFPLIVRLQKHKPESQSMTLWN
jgi:hypothetical protein